MRNNIKVILVSFIGAILALAMGCDNDNTADSHLSESIDHVFECEDCPVFSPEEDTLAFVNRVRSFIAKNVDEGFIDCELCKTYEQIPIDTFPVQTYLNIYKNDEGGTSSGLCCKLMVKILVENGIDAYVYNFGPKQETSSVVLVKHGSILWVVNPRMNYTLLDSDGQAMDFFKLIQLVGKDELEYKTSNDKVTAEMILDYTVLPEGLLALLQSDNCREQFNSLTEIRDSVVKATFERCFLCEKERTCANLIDRMEDGLHEETGLSEFHEALVLKRTSILGAPDAEEMDDRIETAIYSQPNLGKRINRKPIN